MNKEDRIKYGRTNYNAAIREDTFATLEALKMAHGFGSHRELQEYFLQLEKRHAPDHYSRALVILKEKQ